MAGAGGDPPDPPLIHSLAGELVGAAEKGIGRAADGEVFRGRESAQLLALGQRQHQRLFGIDMLAGFEDPLGNREMRIGDGQVDDDVDLRIGQKFVDRLGAHAIFLRAQRRGLRVDIRAGADLDAPEEGGELEIGHGDMAASDDADAEILGHGGSSCQKVLMEAMERVASRDRSLGLSCSTT